MNVTKYAKCSRNPDLNFKCQISFLALDISMNLEH